jgi:hypothetical protein
MYSQRSKQFNEVPVARKDHETLTNTNPVNPIDLHVDLILAETISISLFTQKHTYTASNLVVLEWKHD